MRRQTWLAKCVCFPGLLLGCFIVGWTLPTFYEWTDSNQGRPAPELVQAAWSLVGFGILSWFVIPWLPMEAAAAKDKNNPFQFNLRWLFTITTFTAILIAGISNGPVAFCCLLWVVAFVDGCQRAFLEMAARRFVGMHVLAICLGACLENVQERKLDGSYWRHWSSRTPTGRNGRRNLWQASRSIHLVVYSVDGGRSRDRFLVDPKRPETGDRLLGICHADVHLWFHVLQHRHADVNSQERLTALFVLA